VWTMRSLLLGNSTRALGGQAPGLLLVLMGRAKILDIAAATTTAADSLIRNSLAQITGSLQVTKGHFHLGLAPAQALLQLLTALGGLGQLL